MKNYDIGILSFWNVPNYGTFAQEYALQKVIASITEKRDVRQIAHLDSLHYDFYYNQRRYFRTYPVYSRLFWNSFQMKPESDLEARKRLFTDAYLGIPHTDEITKSNIKDYSFNNVILGSDIIWDFDLRPFNHDVMLFGNMFNAASVNSYAASFGTTKPDAEIPEYVAKGIKNLREISVRDVNSADIVERITGKRPQIVLDPVWLWDFSEDDQIIIPQETDYILVYGQDFTDEFISSLKLYASENSLKTVVLDCNDDKYTWCDILIRQSELDPLEWIGYFKGASAIASSTFHGLTFGLLFNKRVAFCKTDFIMAKAGEFLRDLGLVDIFEDKNNAEGMLKYSWDYEKINPIISRERSKSLDFLTKACR